SIDGAGKLSVSSNEPSFSQKISRLILSNEFCADLFAGFGFEFWVFRRQAKLLPVNRYSSIYQC
ncbi:MAG: hypothetical protein WBN43_03935, partial [Thiogranum sp.]